MRIAVLGAPGQLGKDLLPRLPGGALAWSRVELDLTKPETIAPRLDADKPEVVVNCAAYNLVDIAETEVDKAFATNTFGVRELATQCATRSIRLVHISSDFVFGQNKTRTQPYEITDAPGPVSVYGASKLAGEHFALMASQNNLVIRTCGLYGAWGSGGKGGNFVETMLRLAGMGKAIKVVADQQCTPSYTVDVAETIAQLIAVQATGIAHVTNAGDCSWFEFAKMIFQTANIEANLSPTTTREFAAKAARPAYSVLSCNQLSELGVKKPRPWQQALAAYLAERKTPTTTHS